MEYLNQRIKQDGDWGIILAQTSDEAGLERLVKGSPSDRTPDKLTDNGSTNFIVAGQKVDGMGIFEWIALTFQEDPTKLSTKDVSWLLANRLKINGVPQVPYGVWGGSRVKSDLVSPDYGRDDARPRLAVIALNP